MLVHILHASKCHHTHSPIYLHSPSYSKVHLCWCKCSVKSQMIGLMLRCRPNVTTLLTAVLSILKCLYRIGQYSSYHPAAICSCKCTKLLPYGPSSYLQLPAALWWCVDRHTRLAQMLRKFVLLLIPSRNFSFIMIAVLPTHYAVRQPLQLSPCQKVHP